MCYNICVSVNDKYVIKNIYNGEINGGIAHVNKTDSIINFLIYNHINKCF